MTWSMHKSGYMGTRRFMSLCGFNWLYVHALVASLTDNQIGYYRPRGVVPINPFTEVV